MSWPDFSKVLEVHYTWKTPRHPLFTGDLPFSLFLCYHQQLYAVLPASHLLATISTKFIDCMYRPFNAKTQVGPNCIIILRCSRLAAGFFFSFSFLYDQTRGRGDRKSMVCTACGIINPLITYTLACITAIPFFTTYRYKLQCCCHLVEINKGYIHTQIALKSHVGVTKLALNRKISRYSQLVY